MSVATKDGAWLSTTQVYRIDCSKCGVVSTSNYPMNDREIDKALSEHAAKHGGRWFRD